MRVTALLFAPPGRGEFLRKFFDMPDEHMPTTPAEFALRSVRAVKHFWPACTTGRPLELQVCDQRNVVEGEHWQVEWATDAHTAHMEGFVEKHLAKANTLGELLKAVACIQPTKRVTL
jgi:hypothetical protein